MTPEARIRALIEANRNRAGIHAWGDIASYQTYSGHKRRAAETLWTMRRMRQAATNAGHEMARHQVRLALHMNAARNGAPA